MLESLQQALLDVEEHQLYFEFQSLRILFCHALQKDQLVNRELDFLTQPAQQQHNSGRSNPPVNLLIFFFKTVVSKSQNDLQNCHSEKSLGLLELG